MKKQHNKILNEARVELLTEVFNRTRDTPEKGREFVEILDAEEKARERRKELTAEIFKESK